MSTARTRCLESVDILVLGGGLGTRIRPVLGDTPKLLAPICGRPYLAHLLDWLRRYGARRVVLGLGHQAQMILEHLRADPVRDLELVPVVEPLPLGTAGAIRFARNELHSDPVLVMNGDSFTSADLCEFVARHGEARLSGAAASILCAEVDDASRYGRVEIDDAGWIIRFVEKDPNISADAFVSAGVYLLSASLITQIAAGKVSSLEREVFERLPPRSLAAFCGRFAFIDIGTPESLARAGAIFGVGAAS